MPRQMKEERSAPLLYLMHVPWNWIKQRPHFLAEHLNELLPVHLYYRFYKVPFEKRLVRNEPPRSLPITVLPMLPLDRFAAVRQMNNRLLAHLLRPCLAGSHAAWFTHPDVYAPVAAQVPKNVRIVYDCMDNYPQMVPEGTKRREILEAERMLVERADVILASSAELRDTLQSRYGLGCTPQIVNNAMALPEAEPAPLPERVATHLGGDLVTLAYVGSVAPWLDFELLEAAVRRFDRLRVVLVGPVDAAVPHHERIVATGPVPHGQVFEVMRRADALVMPFVLNAVTTGVNPVKLYEYVYSCRPALAPAYRESQPFGDYVHLYRDREEFLSLVSRLVEGALPPAAAPEAARAFALANTWRQRAAQVAEILSVAEST